MATLPGFGGLPSVPKPPTAPRAYPGYTQEQVNASLAANPNAAGMAGGSSPYFTGNLAGLNSQPGTGVPASFNPNYSTPDYASLIANDPGYLALQQALSAGGIANAAQRAAATQRALITFGLTPDFQHSAQSMGLSPQSLGFLSQDITPDITALANQNTQNGLSTEARLNQAHTKAIMQLRNALAARGALSSGEANYQLNNQEQSYQQSQQDLLGKLLDTILGAQGQYLTSQQQQQAQLAQGLSDAYARQIGLAQNQPQLVNGGSYYQPPTQTYTPPVPPPPAAPSAPPAATAYTPLFAPSVAQAIQTPQAQRGQLERINSMM